MVSRVSEILRHVDDTRQAEQARCTRFLSELTPQVRAAKAAERQRDRQQAPRFNVFKYLSKDELGLSCMIADLLDPTAEHGQGSKFLAAMLDTLPETRGRFGALQPTTASQVSVVTERWTADGGRIDISVDIPSATGRFCLAFENKPYAHDLHRQISAYLEYLAAEYGKEFLLVYLPPIHREPDVASFPPTDRERWRGHFTVMPYAGSDPSLKDWFATCRDYCDAERVRWFLRDAESFCQSQFGEPPMTIDSEAQSVREYLTEHPNHLRAAFAVSRAWTLLSAEVCERFLEHLRHIVAYRLPVELSDIGSDCHVWCSYGGERKYSNQLKIYRDAWVRYDDLPPNSHGRSAIMLESIGPGPNGWFWGVRSPKRTSEMSEEERERREELDAALGRHGLSLSDRSERWPQWGRLSRYRDWDSLVPEIHEECQAGGGPITDYHVNGLLGIASHAIRAINEVELSR